MTTENNGWDQYQKLVMDRLGTLDETTKENRDLIRGLMVDVKSLQVRQNIQSAFWGVLGGLMVAIGSALMVLLG